jgi:hypothetical protein
MKILVLFYILYEFTYLPGAGARPKNFGPGFRKMLLLHRLRNTDKLTVQYLSEGILINYE